MFELLDATSSQSVTRPLSAPIVEHYRCADLIPEFHVAEKPKGSKGFFRFGEDLFCYGRSTAGNGSPEVKEPLFDASRDVRCDGNKIFLPFDVNEVVDNLRYERYAVLSGWQAWIQESWARDLYYQIRPWLPISVRKHLQRAYLKDWDTIEFPSWPIDRSVDVLLERLLILAMKTCGTRRLPFIWFWPEGHKACAIVTHDVETAAGRDFCGNLMDINDDFGIKASFQIVPEERYGVSAEYLQSIRDRGFEVNIHGLNHDGNLFRGRQTFLTKAAKINEYAERFGAQGFRSPVLYRNTDWFQDLNFSYDMSVPNVARLEAQRGGCCTVMPYFLPGGMTELPLTTAEDYTLFHVVNDNSANLWKQQIRILREANGLMTFLVHPDYVQPKQAQDVYRKLLEEIARLRSDDKVWVTLPNEVDRWWRQRSVMKLVPDGAGWKIEGAGCERARVAHAVLDGNRLVYEFQ